MPTNVCVVHKAVDSAQSQAEMKSVKERFWKNNLFRAGQLTSRLMYFSLVGVIDRPSKKISTAPAERQPLSADGQNQKSIQVSVCVLRANLALYAN